MAKFCKKCGQEIQGDMKFCKACGAPVETAETEQMAEKQTATLTVQPKKVNVNGKKKIGIIAVVLIIAIAVLVPVFKNMSVPGYERPLKAQTEGLSKHDLDEYAKSFITAGEKWYLETEGDYFKTSTPQYKDVSYRVTKVEDGDIEDIRDVYNINRYEMSEDEEEAFYESIEEVKTVYADLAYQYNDGRESEGTVDMRMIKANGKWYTIDFVIY